MKTKKWIGEGLKPNSVNCNVLNVLRTLIENKGTTVYIPDGYKKGSASTSLDSKVHFLPTEAGRRIEVVGISSNQERFNFSLKGLVNILVETELDDGLIDLTPKKVYRQYNIIRDSKLMFDYIIAQLDFDSFMDLREAGLLYYNGVKVPYNHCYNSEFLYKVMLKDIPLISLNWAQPINIGLYEMMKEDIEITVMNKYLRKRIKELKDMGISPSEELGKENDIYTEKRDYVAPLSGESYEAECIVYSLPEVEKNYTLPDSDKKFIDEYSIDKCISTLKFANNKLSSIRFMIRSIIMAIENSKKQGSYNWSEAELVPRSKGKYRQFATVSTDDGDILLKREKYTKTIKL